MVRTGSEHNETAAAALDRDCIGSGVAMLILGLLVGGLLGTTCMLKYCKQNAVDCGKAEWVANQKTGKTYWRWKP